MIINIFDIFISKVINAIIHFYLEKMVFLNKISPELYKKIGFKLYKVFNDDCIYIIKKETGIDLSKEDV